MVTLLSLDSMLRASSGDLANDAYAIARDQFGSVVTYSPKVFIPVTKLCRDRCGYCTFAQAPAHLPSPYMEIDDVLEIARQGAEAGVTEALLTLGERPELRYDEAAKWLAARGYRSTVDYVAEVGRAIVNATGLLPHANAGALFPYELEQLREVSASQGMMVESTANLEAHRLAPDKAPARRLETLRAAGEANIAFTTGLLVGIGESRQDRLDTLEAIAEMHRRYGHIQEVIIQNFLPKPRTLMASYPAADDEEFRWTIAAARLMLPLDIHLQAPPNLSDAPGELLAFGIDDFGGISPVTVDHVNPERAWPAIDTLSLAVHEAGLNLAPRLTIYPEFARDLSHWVHPDLHRAVRELANAEMRGREDNWASGGDIAPPIWNLPSPQTPSAISRLLDEWTVTPDWTESEITTLFGARGADLALITEFADDVRRQRSGDDITFVVNRNINYTNVCTFKCRFCAFSKGPLSLNLRGDPYLLTLEQVAERVVEAAAAGATEVCLQGGIHPKFDGDYYIDVVKTVHDAVPEMHIHAFSALEVFEGARRSDMDLESYLLTLKAAGLRTLPGTAAEILDDEVRKIICPDKLSTSEWLDVHRAAHSVGLNSNVTIMFGSVEGPHMWARHLIRTRELQLETGGFTEFVPLPYVHMATPMFVRGLSRRGPTFRETVLMHSIGRLFYAGAIDNIQVSWVKIGQEGSRRVLQSGANDIGGTLMEENISRAAGAIHGQEMDVEALKEMVAPLGRPLVQRTTLYGRK